MNRFVALVLLVIAAPVAAQANHTSGTYSSYKVVEQSGDIVGAEMFVTYGNDHYFATIQCSEGSPGSPILLPLTVTGAEVAFTVPEGTPSGCLEGPFKGRITSKGVELVHQKSGWREFLKKGQSFWVNVK